MKTNDGQMARQILWVGATDSQFTPVAKRLESFNDVRFCKSLPESFDAESLVVIAHARPDTWDLPSIDAVAKRFPMTRFVHVMADWCCGQKRLIGKQAKAPIVYLNELESSENPVARLQREFEPSVQRVIFGEPLVAVYATSRSYQQAIAESLTQAGGRVLELNFQDHLTAAPVEFVVWETSASREEWRFELDVLKRRHPDAKFIALLTFPRVSDFAEFRALDVQVLAQPFALSDLFRCFHQSTAVAVTSAA